MGEVNIEQLKLVIDRIDLRISQVKASLNELEQERSFKVNELLEAEGFICPVCGHQHHQN